MEIRGVIRPRKGSSRTLSPGSIATAPGTTPLNAPRVTVFIKSRDCYDIETIFATLSLTPTEARALAAALAKHADESDAAGTVSE
jgi:hypothetical protein